jgi:hypothetical protein
MVVAGTMIWTSGARAGDGRDDNEGKNGFQGRNDHDRDDWRGSQGRDDDDWDDHDRDHRRERYAIGLWGDLPYSDAQALGIPKLLADMNSQNLAFTVHDGDLKQGNGLPICDNTLYSTALANFNSLHAPAIFTPGDNDWVDCDRPNNGGFNSLERLSHEREVFFNTHYSLGMHRLRQAVQTDVFTTPCKGFGAGTGTTTVNAPQGLDTLTYTTVGCLENRRWTYRGVTYATLNIQGSCNNRCGDHFDTTEATYREAAVKAWMQETFQVAKDRNSAGVMFISQADPGFSDRPVESEPARDPKTLLCKTSGTGACVPPTTVEGFQDFLLALRAEVIAFGKPVAYVHGDTHYFRVDKPFLDSAGGRLENFTRIETFGDNAANGTNDVNWVKVLVDPDSREVFAIQPQIVPDNKIVHPTP